jgi:hypothetical protein
MPTTIQLKYHVEQEITNLCDDAVDTRWVSEVQHLQSFGSASGTNMAHDVETDTLNNTIVVGNFDSIMRVGKHVLSTDFPAVFVVKSAPNGTVLWAMQSTFVVKKNVPYTACAYSVAVDGKNNNSIVVGGAFSSADLTFAGQNGRNETVQSYAKDTSAFILRLTADGNVEYLRGPLALTLQYITAVAADDEQNVYAAGFYLGAVYFDR